MTREDEAAEAEPKDAATREIERLRRELDMLTTGGIIEVAVRNPSVSEYMEHWEGRALKAEASLAAIKTAQVAEDERFEADLLAAYKGMNCESIARVLSGRLRQMDKRAREANRRADAALALPIPGEENTEGEKR